MEVIHKTNCSSFIIAQENICRENCLGTDFCFDFVDMLIHVNRCQQMPTDANRCQRVSTNVDQFWPLFKASSTAFKWDNLKLHDQHNLGTKMTSIICILDIPLLLGSCLHALAGKCPWYSFQQCNSSVVWLSCWLIQFYCLVKMVHDHLEVLLSRSLPLLIQRECCQQLIVCSLMSDATMVLYKCSVIFFNLLKTLVFLVHLGNSGGRLPPIIKLSLSCCSLASVYFILCSLCQ